MFNDTLKKRSIHWLDDYLWLSKKINELTAAKIELDLKFVAMMDKHGVDHLEIDGFRIHRFKHKIVLEAIQ